MVTVLCMKALNSFMPALDSWKNCSHDAVMSAPASSGASTKCSSNAQSSAVRPGSSDEPQTSRPQFSSGEPVGATPTRSIAPIASVALRVGHAIL